MAYVKTTWVNNAPPPISGPKLNNLENGVGDAHQLAAEAQAAADTAQARADAAYDAADTAQARADAAHDAAGTAQARADAAYALADMDTGWRNISSLLVNGWAGGAYIRRVGKLIDLRIEGLEAAQATVGHFLDIPAGFPLNGPAHVRFALHTTGADFRRAYASGLVVVSGWGPSDVLYGQAIGSSNAPWPSSLPGNPA